MTGTFKTVTNGIVWKGQYKKTNTRTLVFIPAPSKLLGLSVPTRQHTTPQAVVHVLVAVEIWPLWYYLVEKWYVEKWCWLSKKIMLVPMDLKYFSSLATEGGKKEKKERKVAGMEFSFRFPHFPCQRAIQIADSTSKIQAVRLEVPRRQNQNKTQAEAPQNDLTGKLYHHRDNMQI